MDQAHTSGTQAAPFVATTWIRFLEETETKRCARPRAHSTGTINDSIPIRFVVQQSILAPRVSDFWLKASPSLLANSYLPPQLWSVVTSHPANRSLVENEHSMRSSSTAVPFRTASVGQYFLYVRAILAMISREW